MHARMPPLGAAWLPSKCAGCRMIALGWRLSREVRVLEQVSIRQVEGPDGRPSLTINDPAVVVEEVRHRSPSVAFDCD